ncbi:hypothetical protein ACR5KS_03615 [Leucobacter sp. W1153]|uniref:hypothetical protein n=1 Tax=Leucobacter sp. W1153 TaxID=3439064 RepID=UPI003F35FF5F
MSSTRMKGSALSLTFDGVDYWADVTSASLTNVPIGQPLRDFQGHPLPMNLRYFLQGTAIQSLDTNSFWRYAWSHAGQRIDFRYAPLGNQEPEPSRPHFVGKVHIGPPPTVGGDAGNGEYAFGFEWEVLGKPDLDEDSTRTS